MTAPSSGTAPTVREARAQYFAANGFDERGYADRWVRLQAGPIPLFIPNTRSRVRAVRVHDVHHVVTGYATTFAGEAEIGAWEIASGCADHGAAWVLNLLAMPIGLVRVPRATFRAFVRGRHTQNLYRRSIDDTVLDRPVADLIRDLDLDYPIARATTADIAAFVCWSLLGVATFAVALAATLGPIAAFLALLLR